MHLYLDGARIATTLASPDLTLADMKLQAADPSGALAAPVG